MEDKNQTGDTHIYFCHSHFGIYHIPTKPGSSQIVWYSNEMFEWFRVVLQRSLAALISSWKYSYLNAICYNIPSQDNIFLFNKPRAIRVLEIMAFSLPLESTWG